MTSAASLPALPADAPDSEIARRVALGDDAALRLMMRRHNQRLFRTARAILRDDAEAEDAVQEAYLRAIAAIGSFRNDSRLSTWLVRITVNEAVGRLRRMRRGAELIPLAADISERPLLDEAPDAEPDRPEPRAVRAETRRIVEAGIDALPDSYRAVFVMRALEELSVEETAAVLGVPEATVRSRFFRARALLRESLARELDLALDHAFHFAGERCDRIIARVLERLAPPPGA